MKSVKLSTLDRDLAAGDTVPLERKRALLRAIDEGYFKADLAPGLALYDGAVTEVKNGDAWVSRFPAALAGDNRHMAIQRPVRPLWALTLPVITFWYTSAVGSTNTFTFRWVVRVFGAGGTTTNSLSVVDVNLPGPAGANTWLKGTIRAAAKIPAAAEVVQLRLGRLGGDANANALDILQAVVQFQESA